MARSMYTFFIFQYICVLYQPTYCMSIYDFVPKNLFSTNMLPYKNALPDKTQIKNAALFLACTALPKMVNGCHHCYSSSPQDSPKHMDTAGIVITTVGSVVILTMGCTAAWCMYCIDVSRLPDERRRKHEAFWLRICHTFGCYKDISIPEESTSISLETVTIRDNLPVTE